MAYLAQYPRECTVCGKPINVGDPIAWNRRAGASSAVRHFTCIEKAPVLAGFLTVQLYLQAKEVLAAWDNWYDGPASPAPSELVEALKFLRETVEACEAKEHEQ